MIPLKPREPPLWNTGRRNRKSFDGLEITMLELESIARMSRGFGILAILWLLSPVSSAACAKDRKGEIFCGGGSCTSDRSGVIWCSRFKDGGARITRDGQVLCGKGQCARDSRGRVFCSSMKGGAVLKDSRGRVRCFGQCERAKAEWCENTRAGSSD